MTRAVPLLALDLLALALCAGCPEPTPAPCESDPYACNQATAEFQIDPTCTLAGALDVELGQGQFAYEPLAAGAPPTVYHGSQGGTHLFLALRVKNAALDRYGLLKVGFEVVGDVSGELGGRSVLLGKGKPIQTTPEGVVEEAGLVTVIDFWPEGEVRHVRVTVDDPCSRHGEAEHVVPATAAP